MDELLCWLTCTVDWRVIPSRKPNKERKVKNSLLCVQGGEGWRRWMGPQEANNYHDVERDDTGQGDTERTPLH